MPANNADLASVKQFLSETMRAVLITRRRDGRVQSSPMRVAADDQGNVLINTRRTAAKVKNLVRDPYAALTLITERFLGDWMHVEGNATIEYLPEALPALQDFHRRVGSQDTDSDAFKQRLQDEGRCLITVHVSHVVRSPVRPDRPGR
jgi:PPOX class probable F420-dependent enzyme